MKEQLFTALLRQVPFDGWSDVALRRAAQEVGMDVALARDYFPDALSMIDYHHRLCDAAMVVPASGGITAKVRAAILSRLDFVEQDREAVRRALSFLALPHNLYAATKMSYRSADAIWQAAGSQDRGFDWVTKRSSLAGVYGATLLFWLCDRGQNRAALEAFLDRQLALLLGVMKPLNQAKSGLMKRFSTL